MDSFIDSFDTETVTQKEIADISQRALETNAEQVLSYYANIEKLENAKAAITERDIQAHYCHDCRTWSRIRENVCVQGNHRVERRNTRLRFFRCGRKNCGHIVNVIAIFYPISSCSKCGFSGWVKTGLSNVKDDHGTVPMDYQDAPC
ncbi:hypothetical protein XU18_0141 [Perkinsela sp. CCAP 1560/4]|nr:hypothetical protein XU18_0141 [Perkinsela sp. CCAP 1560/4]|eukprot:KNH09456.1 hypothetical protein XU18_0141 [Perkinsela sp. CCAP 1560/4]